MRARLNLRGQTLTVFALTMLLMVVLVCMTLSIGMKTKEKMEVQALADAAAYTNAAFTARVYNQMALMSRAQIGHMVSLAGVQSLISWSSAYRANAEAIVLNYFILTAQYGALAGRCCNPWNGCLHKCPCAIVATINNIISAFQVWSKANKAFKQWDNLDKAASNQVRALQGAAGRLYLAGQMVEYVRLFMTLNGDSQAGEVVSRSNAGPGVSASSGTGWINVREAWVPGVGAINPVPLSNQHHVYATMGSRGFTFTTSRMIASFILQGQLHSNLMPRRDTVTVFNQGSAYFAPTQNHGGIQANSAASWADDHGINMVKHDRANPPCPKYVSAFPTFGALRSTDKRDTSDRHTWFPNSLTGPGDREPALKRHTFENTCNLPRLGCPNMWYLFTDYNPVQLLIGGNNYGQPKNYAVVQRNYGAGRADPWNLFFRFRFTPQGSTFDNRGIVLADGTNISRQTALSAGIAYYHRRNAWREPPNLLNPYWRATLVPVTVDAEGRGGDVPAALNGAGVGWAAQAWSALRAQGYKGGP